MISTSGAALLPHEAINQLCSHILPHTTVLTPNIPEALLILSQNGQPAPEVRSVADIEDMARRIQALGPKWVLVKGGHRPMKEDLTAAEKDDEKKLVVDVLVGGEGGQETVRVQSPYQESTSTHGTGCSLACKYFAILFDTQPVDWFNSRYCLQPSPRTRDSRRGTFGVSIHRSRHQNGTKPGQGTRSPKPLPLDLYATVLSVSKMPWWFCVC